MSGYKHFFVKRNEISLEQGCVLWSYRFIVPPKFRNTILNELHEFHIGIVEMKSLFLYVVAVEHLAKSCSTCCSLAPVPEKSALRPWVCPKEIWTRSHVDHFGPIKNKYVLLMRPLNG